MESYYAQFHQRDLPSATFPADDTTAEFEVVGWVVELRAAVVLTSQWQIFSV